VSAQGEEVEMRNLFKRRPSPSLLVAIAVLVAALTGGAIAGVATVSVLSKSEKIADQKIDQRAPDLAVKFAATAGVATLGGNNINEGLRGDISANPTNIGTNIVYVLTSSRGAGVNADRPFTLLIRC
jgi:hypothetical protein